jgi:hypothetical protein
MTSDEFKNSVGKIVRYNTLEPGKKCLYLLLKVTAIGNGSYDGWILSVNSSVSFDNSIVRLWKSMHAHYFDLYW